MDIQGLKDKVLQLAIQGKLVEQCESDEPASVLLDRIKKEKGKLVKDKVIKKEKPLPEIADKEKLFEIPMGWEWCRLGEISQIAMGQSPDSSTVSEEVEGVEFHQGKTFFGRTYLKRSGIYCTKPCKIANTNDVLLSVRAPVGILNIATKTICIGRGLSSIRGLDAIESLFLYYFITALKDELVNKSTGTTFKDVSSVVIKEILIPLPPLEEQKRIVAKVDELFKLIDELDKNKQDLLDNITNARNKILQLAIQGKLVKQCEEDEAVSVLLDRIKKEKEQLIRDKVIKKDKKLPEISEDEKKFGLPKSWIWTKIGSISQKIHYGYTASATYNNTGTKFLRITDIQDNKVNWNTVPFCEIKEDKLNSCKLEKDDLLIARTGGTIGKSFIVTNLVNNAVFASYLIRIKPSKQINSKYIKIFLESQYYWKQLQEKSQGTGQANVNAVSLSNLVMPLPPLDEQKRIVSKVDLIMTYLDKLQHEIELQEIILKELGK